MTRRWRAVLALATLAGTARADLIVAEQQTLRPSLPGTVDFAQSVDLSGSFALCGTRQIGDGPGACFAYLQVGREWRQIDLLRGFDVGDLDAFGAALAIDGDVAVVGAHLHDLPADNAGAVYVFARSGLEWTQEAKLTASDGAAGDLFGRAVALDGNTLVVGASRDDDGAHDAGAAYVFERVGTSWFQRAKLNAPVPVASSYFGRSVEIEGGTILIGAYEELVSGEPRGAAYVFVGGGAGWALEQRLIAADGAAHDSFGFSLALEGDTALVGAQHDDDAGSGSGSAYVFRRSGTLWTQTQKLTASDATSADNFGHALALAGGTAFVSAYQWENGSGDSVGAVYRFKDVAGTWVESSRFEADDGEHYDLFGADVAFDGGALLVGASNADAPGEPDAGGGYVFVNEGAGWYQQDELYALGPDGSQQFGRRVDVQGARAAVGWWGGGDAPAAGSVIVYEQDAEGWTEDARLVASDGTAGDRLHTVALDGDTLLAGAESDDVNGEHSGSVYVFVRETTGWVEEARLTPHDAGPGQRFGGALALDGERAFIAASALADVVPGPGAVYVFERSGTSWSQVARLSASDGEVLDAFGWSLDVDREGGGTTLLIGAPFDDDGGDGAGAAYVFERSGGLWVERAKLTDPSPDIGALFGFSVALSNGRALIGAPYDDTPGAGAGTAHVFEGGGSAWSQRLELIPADLQPNDHHGWSVDLEGDRAAIGAYLYSDTGGAFVYARGPTGWRQQATLLPEGRGFSSFGWDVALSGSALLVGEPFDDLDVLSAGSVTAFSVLGSAASFCDASDDALASCPCNNPGAPDAGCDLAQGTGGVRLALAAQSTTPLNRATLTATGFPAGGSPGVVVLRATGLDAASPVVFGDGLRCVGTPVVRLAATLATGGASTHTFGHGATAGSGGFRYQAWFRNTPATYCTLDAFNLSSGTTLAW